MKGRNDGFTYIDVLVSMGIVFMFIGILLQLNQYNYKLRLKADELNKMTMVAQGVMDAYREQGKAMALTYNQGYTVDIVEDVGTGHLQLKKVIVSVSPKVTGVRSISLVSYHSE